MSEVTVNEERLRFMVAMLGDELSFTEFSDVDNVVQELTGANFPTPFELPEGAAVVAYTPFDSDPGFVFGLRPTNDSSITPELQFVTVVGLFVDSPTIEPRDAEGRLPVDGAELDDIYAAVLEMANNIAAELNSLVPAYERLWG